MLEALYDYQSTSPDIETGQKTAGDDEIDALDITPASHPLAYERYRRRMRKQRHERLQQQQHSQLPSFSHRLHAFRMWIQDRLHRLSPHTVLSSSSQPQQQHPSSDDRHHHVNSSAHHSFNTTTYIHPADITWQQAESDMDDVIEHLQANESSHDTLNTLIVKEQDVTSPHGRVLLPSKL
ncbi:hypothetical protein BDF22DRAFT_745280 [Syncephalis plumigaleata]|nr:hypothetical protein BDF22DRAFT_745280 [Syncephalis plumigaleata]